MLAGHGDVKFMKVDASKKNYEDLTAAVGINTQELTESPSLLLMKGGKGRWIHGTNTISEGVKYY